MQCVGMTVNHELKLQEWSSRLMNHRWTSKNNPRQDWKSSRLESPTKITQLSSYKHSRGYIESIADCDGNQQQTEEVKWNCRTCLFTIKWEEAAMSHDFLLQPLFKILIRSCNFPHNIYNKSNRNGLRIKEYQFSLLTMMTKENKHE